MKKKDSKPQQKASKNEDVKPKKVKKKKEHYVDAKVFAELIVRSYETDFICDELADCVLKISTRLSFAPNFINYSYKDEMVGDAVVKMLQAIKNQKFNPEKGNAFSYFTRIAFNAFCNRIKKEKKEKEFILNLQDTIYDDMMGGVSEKEQDNDDGNYTYGDD